MERGRIYTFDVVKGIAILLVIPLHALIYQIGNNDPALFEPLIAAMPQKVIYLLFPAMVLSMWGPIFALVTGANIAYGFLRVYNRDPEQSSAYILRRILAAFLLLFVSRTAVFIFEGGMFTNGFFNIFNYKIRYYADTLDAIALTGIIVPVFILLLLEKSQAEKQKSVQNNSVNRKNVRRIYLGMTIITLIWFIFTPVVHALTEPVLNFSSKHNLKLPLILWSKLTAGRFRLFPILGFGYAGAVIGAAIHAGGRYKNIRKYAGIFFLITLAMFLLWLWLTDNPIVNVASDDIPVMMQVLNLGAMTFATVLMLGRFDYCKPEKRQRRIERSLWVRKFSIVSLTIYVMEFFLARGVYWLFEQFWDNAVSLVNQVPVLVWNVTQIFVFIIVICLLWIIIVPFWQKVDFMFSLEWFMIKADALFRHNKKARINSNKILYGE
ncbi:MAG: hypothetical protein M0R44_02415 [Candidatus Marinimicrobia bacterium]|jgi:hypothetical protein|nr:hypothetical protein [Candidatus Neomarinimicrobiota bacterium]